MSTIHFVVNDPEGAIKSEPHMATVHGTPIQISAGGTFGIACGFSKDHLGTKENLASDCPWAVNCEQCRDTKVFKKLNRPKPGQTDEPNLSVTVSDKKG